MVVIPVMFTVLLTVGMAVLIVVLVLSVCTCRMYDKNNTHCCMALNLVKANCKRAKLLYVVIA